MIPLIIATLMMAPAPVPNPDFPFPIEVPQDQHTSCVYLVAEWKCPEGVQAPAWP